MHAMPPISACADYSIPPNSVAGKVEIEQGAHMPLQA